MPKYSLAQVDDWKIVKLYTQDFWTKKQIAEHLHWSIGAIDNRLRANGVKIRPPGGGKWAPKRLPQEVIDQTVEYYLDGMTAERIGQVMGVTRTTVYGRLEMAGIKRRNLASRGWCKNFHDFTPENTQHIVTKRGNNVRVCKTCRREATRRARARAKEAKVAVSQ